MPTVTVTFIQTIYVLATFVHISDISAVTDQIFTKLLQQYQQPQPQLQTQNKSKKILNRVFRQELKVDIKGLETLLTAWLNRVDQERDRRSMEAVAHTDHAGLVAGRKAWDLKPQGDGDP